MTSYIYSDEDNEPMYDEPWDLIDRDGHNPTVYTSYAEMRAIESGLPFTDPKPDDGCWNCFQYDGNRCHKDWNNNEEDYYLPDRDDKEPTDWCSDHDKDESIKPEEFFDGTYP